MKDEEKTREQLLDELTGMRSRLAELEEMEDERKWIVAALRESENRFRSLVLNSSDTITVLADDGSIKYQSPSLKRFFGYEPDDMVGKNAFSYVHPDDLATAQTAFSQILKHPGTSASLEYRFRHANGAWVFVESMGSSFLDDPSISGVVLNSRDISERKRAEEALEKRIVALTQPLEAVEGIVFEDLFNLSELQHLQDLCANAWGVAALITRPDGTPITRPGNFTYFCGEFIRKNKKGWRNCQISDAMLGRHNPSGPIIQKCMSAGLWGAGASITVGGRHIANWLIGQVRNEAQSEEEILAYAREIGADEAAFREAFLKVPVMCQEKFEQIAHTLFALASQLSTSAYQNIQQARFIAERKQAEENLRTASRYARSLIEASLDPLVTISPEGKITDVNRATELVTGVAREHLIGDDFLNYFTEPEKAREGYQKVLSDASVRDYPLTIRHKSGKTTDVLFNATVFRNELGDMQGVFAAARDITARKQAEKALADSAEKLKFFAYSVAHDLKSPAVGVYGLTKRLSKHARDLLDEKGKTYCDQILKVSEHIAALVDKINIYIATKEARLSLETINLADILHMLNDEFSAQLRIRRIEWLKPETTVEIQADRLCLLRVFRNFMDNSLKYGGERLSRIWTGHEESEDFHILSFSDNGKGLKEQDAEKIFGAFQRHETSRGVEGAGLGLTIVKEIAEQHGGKVWVEPRSKKGVTFYLSISKNL